MNVLIVTPWRVMPAHLLHRLRDRVRRHAAEAHRPLDVQLLARVVGGRLAVGDDQHLRARRRVLREQPLGDHQPFLEIGERVAHVPGDLGQLGGRELARARREADHEEVVAREARAHEVVERERHALRRREAAPPTDIDQLMSSRRTVVVCVA
jgi:hypothetical protein